MGRLPVQFYSVIYLPADQFWYYGNPDLVYLSSTTTFVLRRRAKGKCKLGVNLHVIPFQSIVNFIGSRNLIHLFFNMSDPNSNEDTPLGDESSESKDAAKAEDEELDALLDGTVIYTIKKRCM